MTLTLEVKDEKLEYESYFYERKKDLEKALNSTDRISHENLWNNIRNHFEYF